MDGLQRRYGLGEQRWTDIDRVAGNIVTSDTETASKTGPQTGPKTGPKTGPDTGPDTGASTRAHIGVTGGFERDAGREPPTLLLVPVGSCEQHGPHLPLATDTLIASALAFLACPRLVHRWRPLVAPAIAIAASGEHAGFAGTLSVGVEVTTDNLIELVRSADWADRIVFVNGHGGNTVAIGRAVQRSHDDGRRHVDAWSPDGDAVAAVVAAHRRTGTPPPPFEHAGFVETAAMLHLYPNLVDLGAARPGPGQIDVDSLFEGGVVAVSPNGVVGDPSGADAKAGSAIVRAWLDDLCAFVSRIDPA